MAAIATGDEVQAGAIGRVERGVNRFATDHGDRGRRQAGDGVGVVGRRLAQVGAGDLAVVALTHAVDHRRVGLQHHAQAQAPHENASDLPALLGNAGLLLYQRGHDQRLVRVTVWQVGGALGPLLGQHFVQAHVGLLQQLDVAHTAHEAVGVREEAPLGKHTGMAELVHHFRIGQPIQRVLDLFMLGHGRAHLAEGPAFDQGQVVLHHVGPTPGIEQLLHGHAGGQAVFAGVQGGAGHVEAPVQAQPDGVVEQPFVLHAIEHAIGGGAIGHVEQALLRHVQGLLQDRVDLPGRPAHGKAGEDQAHFQQQQEFTSHEFRFPVTYGQRPAVYG
ncbi:hypothetical protein D3C72_1178430 [compost metagenome]